MLFFQKSSSSSSLPSPSSSPSPQRNVPGGSTRGYVDDRGRSLKRLTRQRKLRHITDQELLGLHSTARVGSSPGSPDSDLKIRNPCGSDHRSSSAVPLPLPLPESPLTKRPELLDSNSGRDLAALPEEGSTSAFTRSNIDHTTAKSSDCRRRFFNGRNVESRNCDLRLSIPARSAPSSGFTSPVLSPRRSNAADYFPSFVESSSNIHRGLSHDLTVKNVNFKSNWTGSPRSAPTSGFSSPVVSPQRSNTGDFLPSYVAPREFQVWPALEVPDFGRLPFHTSQASIVRNGLSPDYSPHHSPPSQSSPLNPRSPRRFSFPLHHKEWPECNSPANAHPLPRPPGAAPSQSIMSSPPAVIHHPLGKPNVSLQKGQWQKGKLIGRGTYGSVYVGTNRETGASCAIKEVDIVPDDPKSTECIKQLQQEIRVLQTLKHQNIVQYYGSEIVDDHFYIYLEHVYPGSISKYVREHCGEMTESIVRNFTRHILFGLAYLHSTKTIHRDIKGANLLVDSSGIVKLADFGMAKHLTGLSYELSLKGSPHWMAPEVIKAVMQKDASPDLAFAVDIWSLGCTIIEMFTGKPPWGELHGPQAMFKVLHKTPPIPETLSPEGKDFLCCCFQRNPADRPPAQKLLDHPFVRNSNNLNTSACINKLSAIKLMDKHQGSGDCITDKADPMSTSLGRRIVNGKLPMKSETNQQCHVKIHNCATSSRRSSNTTFGSLPCLSRTQLGHGSHNFSSSSNIPSNMPISAANNHPLSLSSNRGREIPHI